MSEQRASSQAAQRAANLLPLSLSARLIGQLSFHSTSSQLRLHFVCFPVGWMESEKFDRKENTNVKVLLENVLSLT